MSILEHLQNPPKAYTPAAFWFWYGDLKPDRLRHQIDLMVQQGVYNGFMHSRAYLKTPYLEQGWWDAVSACVDEGNRTGFHPWLYDEYAWPSGTAGSTFEFGFQKPSRVLARGTCNMAKSLEIRRYASAAEFQAEKEVPLYAYSGSGSSWKLLQGSPRTSGGEIIGFFLKIHPTVADYMNRDTIRLFMDFTHEAYKDRFGKWFGDRIPGIFFDEIYMKPEQLPWTQSFPAEFRARRGYDLTEALPAMAVEGGEKEQQLRKDYYKTAAELYESAFFGQISDWCTENHLQLTGHTEEFLSQHPGRQGNYFSTMRRLHIPGADNHDYRYRFPRKITYCEPKYSVSVSRAYGHPRAMSEAMGGAGWGCSLQTFKRGINTMGAMGISMFTLHGFYTECDTQGSQSDWPTSFFYQNPYWRYFHCFADYAARVCYMNAQGSPVVDVGLFYPIELLQARTVCGKLNGEGQAISRGFHTVLNSLLEHQTDTDMIDSCRILDADVSDGRIRVGQQAFRVLICPEIMEKDPLLEEKLEQFRKNGGILLQYLCRPGKERDSAVLPEHMLRALRSRIQPDVQLLSGDHSDLFSSHRRIDGKECYFISNSSPAARKITLLLRETGSVQRISPEDGIAHAAPAKTVPNGTEVVLELKEDEACWLILTPGTAADSAPAPAEPAEQLAAAGRWKFLPIPRELTGEAQLSLKSNVLRIPLARFHAENAPESTLIRIQDREAADGFCGRHMSLWHGSWITRRPGWACDVQKKELFFRKTFTLNQCPGEARVCIAAVNQWTLWLNGQEIAGSETGLTPTQLDAGKWLKKGENTVAVRVINPTPLRENSLCSVEVLPKDRMISLLFDMEIRLGEETLTVCSDSSWAVVPTAPANWMEPGFCAPVEEQDPAKCRSGGIKAPEDAWLTAWERGHVPMEPWGELPRFGRLISYPRKIAYTLTLPAGTARLAYPDVSGENIRILADGMEPVWKNGCCRLTPDGRTHSLLITLDARSGKDGLHKAVEVEAVPFSTALSDWRLHGLEWYSGFARYENTVTLRKEAGRYSLDLGQVGFQAEVWINGCFAGERVWQPYRLDITDLLRDGSNTVTVIAANSAAVERQFMLVDAGMALGWNRYWNEDNIQREGENLVSGLLGPVQIFHTKE